MFYSPQTPLAPVVHATTVERVQTTVIHLNADVLLDFWETDVNLKVKSPNSSFYIWLIEVKEMCEPKLPTYLTHLLQVELLKFGRLCNISIGEKRFMAVM